MSDTIVALPFGEVIVSADQLEELYRAPGQLVAAKKRPGIDEGTRSFIERSPFVLIGTVGRDGGVDVSPRGGPRGFVRIIDDEYLAIPDLNGNNLIDSLRGVVASGSAGMLLLVPGKDETVRVNGAGLGDHRRVGARPVGRRAAATDHRHRRACRRGVRALREGVPARQGLGSPTAGPRPPTCPKRSTCSSRRA